MQILETKRFHWRPEKCHLCQNWSEVAWYQAHITNYLDTDTLTDLFNKSSESQSRYATNTTSIIDESLFDIGLSQEIGWDWHINRYNTDLKNYINDQVAAGKLKLDPFNMWLNDTDSVLQELQNNETTATTKIQGVYTQSYGTTSIYNSSIAILTSSIDPLTQLNIIWRRWTHLSKTKCNERSKPKYRYSPPTPDSNATSKYAASLSIDWKSLPAKIKPILANIFNKFYSNKKIFWPISIAFGLIFLVIVLGLLFGKKRNVPQAVTMATATPIPTIQSTPQATSSGNILTDSQNKLNDLKNQINNLDVQQSRLQPPTLDFNISFTLPK